jgi:hypothetical protein
VGKQKILFWVLFSCVLLSLFVGCNNSSTFTPTDSTDIDGLIGIMQNEIKIAESNNCSISIDAEEGEKIEFTFDSNVKKGSLLMKLTGPHSEPVEFKNNTNDTKTVVTENKGGYTLWVKYDNFVGYYKIYATKDDGK